MAAMKDVSPGIQAVEARLRRAGDGRPRLFLMRDALVRRDSNLEIAHLPLCTADEFPAYVWQKVAEGKTAKEEPLKVNDHGCDAMRYGVMYLDGQSPAAGQTVNIPDDVYRPQRRSILWKN